MTIDYTNLSDPQLMTAQLHLERLADLFKRADRLGAYTLFMAEATAAAEEINLRRQARDTKEFPAVGQA